MAIAECRLQEKLCKSCTYFKRINENKAYCPFGKCVWQEQSSTIDNKIKTIKYINRLSGEVKTIAVYVPESGEQNVKRQV